MVILLTMSGVHIFPHRPLHFQVTRGKPSSETRTDLPVLETKDFRNNEKLWFPLSTKFLQNFGLVSKAHNEHGSSPFLCKYHINLNFY